MDTLVDPLTIMDAVAEIEILEGDELVDDLESLSTRSGLLSSKTTESTIVRYAQAQNIIEEQNEQLAIKKRINEQQRKQVKKQKKQIEKLQTEMAKILAAMKIQKGEENDSESNKSGNEDDNESEEITDESMEVYSETPPQPATRADTQRGGAGSN